MRDNNLTFSEKVMYRLRDLYAGYGYSQYKMSKFEEYDLYARNKDFLISDSVITFTDTNGKLMALKPDVTLSIVKNSADEVRTVQKLFYNENVYRVAKGSGTFREIPQAGLECLGNVDDYCISEVLLLAAKSLQSIDDRSVLVVSHMGILSDAMDVLQIPAQIRRQALKYICEKNMHELGALCDSAQVSAENSMRLKQLAVVSGSADQVLERVAKIMGTGFASPALQQLQLVLEDLAELSLIRVDFSAGNDVNYYNGIVFQGFIPGIPESVLSGGQYDTLMQKRNRKAGAIGFAIYLDLLERMEQARQPYDVDVLIVYEPGTPLALIHETANRLASEGNTILVQPEIPKNIRYQKCVQLSM